MDLAGSTIYFADAFHQGFALSDCQRVTLTQFEIDFLKSPYTYVQMASVSPSQRMLVYNLLPDRVDPATFNGSNAPSGPLVLWAVAFRNGRIVPGTSRMHVAEPIANHVLQLVQDNTPWTQSATLSTLQPGDTIVVTQRGDPPSVIASNSDSITISNATVYGLFESSIFLDIHRLPELFCGFSRQPGRGPTLYPVACSPQAWAAGSVFLVLQSCLGLTIKASESRIYFHYPALPESFQSVKILNLKVGSSSVDLELHRHKEVVSVEILRREGDLEIATIK